MTISLDNLIANRSWRDPAAVRYYLGNRTVAQINALTPAMCDAYVVTDAGVVNPGALAVAAGDLIEFDGTDWQMIVTNSGGFPPNGTRAVVGYPAASATLFSPLVDGTDEGKIATWGGASLTPILEISLDGWAVLIKGTLTVTPSCDENKQYVFQGVVPTGSWTLVGADAPIPVPTTDDKSLAPTPGTGNFQTTGLTITHTPALGGQVDVFVNGIKAIVGNGNRLDLGDFTNNVECYFSADGGATARTMAAIVTGDTLYWNGTNAGYDLLAADRVDINYEAF